MLLAREFVAYLSRQLVKRLMPDVIETPNPDLVAQKIAEVITQELAVEDRLNDEVRDLLSQYSDYMRRESVSYQEMFRRIKNTLISQRKVIRASGRDTGDAMKLSRDKVTDMSHRIVEMLRKSRELRLKDKDPNNVRLEILRHMMELLVIEDKVDRTARLIAAARPLAVTFHRAFDLTPDPRQALEDLVSLGVDRVLTSGQEASAFEGRERIAELQRQAAERIVVMPGGGITPGNVGRIIEATGVSEVHLSARREVKSGATCRNDRVRERRARACPIKSCTQTCRHPLQQATAGGFERLQMLHEAARRFGAGVHRHPPGAGGQHLRLHALCDHGQNIRLIFV